MAKVSKTIGPLHFEDLEPHRFEDLVRQLIYDFRSWKAIEATGRVGLDEGFDARAWESIYEESPESEKIEKESMQKEDRIWLIQCKREKSITPKKIQEYIKRIVVDRTEPLYGIIFVAACDFSKRTRDVFIEEIRKKGFQEFRLWGKAELEDMLFQPKNDHLLFAYFGVSLLIRRRSLKTQIRSKLTTKRKVIRYLGGVSEGSFEPVLIRDARDTSYPYKDELEDLDKKPKWYPYFFVGHYHDGIEILFRKHFAYLADDQIGWDYVKEVNDARTHDNPWENRRIAQKNDEKRHHVYDYWSKIPEKNRAWLEIITLIPYERIIEIDGDGDTYFNHPHIYVELSQDGGFFEKEYKAVLKTAGGLSSREIYNPDPENRIRLFPGQFPKPKQSNPKRKNPTKI